MTFDWSSASDTRSEWVAPYVAAILDDAAGRAVRLHARAVSTEHFLLAMLADEDCGAHRLILHAFADPETLYAQVLALSPGILVVGSSRSLPFSPHGVQALYSAKATAEARGSAQVELGDLVSAAFSALGADAQARATEAGGTLEEFPTVPAAAFDDDPSSPFAAFDDASKRALGRAAKVATELRRASVAPAHLLLAALEADSELGERIGLPRARARMVLAGTDDEDPPPAERSLAPDPGLRALLERLPAGAGTALALSTIVEAGTSELQLLLSQQRITLGLVGATGALFDDP